MGFGDMVFMIALEAVLGPDTKHNMLPLQVSFLLFIHQNLISLPHAREKSCAMIKQVKDYGGRCPVCAIGGLGLGDADAVGLLEVLLFC